MESGALSGTDHCSPTTIDWVGELQWLLVLWGYWIDNHRCKTQKCAA